MPNDVNKDYDDELNRKHEMFLNYYCIVASSFQNQLNRKHEMFLNFINITVDIFLNFLNRKHEMFLNRESKLARFGV